jgi:hypothetical protein
MPYELIDMVIYYIPRHFITLYYIDTMLKIEPLLYSKNRHVGNDKK